MAGQRQRGPETAPREYVNILLPHGIDQLTQRMTRGSPARRRTREEYTEARAAAEQFEAETRGDVFPEYETDPNQIRAILGRLAGRSELRGALGVADLDLAPEEIPYLSVSDLAAMGIAPPEGTPLVVPEIGLISVPAPAEVGVQAIQSAIQDTGARVEPAGIVYALPVLEAGLQPGLQVEEGEAEAVGYPADLLFEAEEPGVEWLEAALEDGTAAETIPWGVARVNAPRAWARGYLGQGVRVAVVDTGIAPHPDLARPVAGATFVPGTTSPNDDHGHGTHVAGTIAALRNGRGLIGVAPRAQLLAAKVLDRLGSGRDTWVAAGIVWAANNGARIINLSLGSAAFSTAIQRALVYARSRRVAICAAAGNSSTPTSCVAPPGYPGRDPLCICIAATDQMNRKAPFSQCGAELDLAAPGVAVISTFPGSGYRSLNGTSMATPHIAGVAALVLSRPATAGLDPARLQRHLERTAIGLGPAHQFGRGLVQADRAVTFPISGAELAAELDGLYGNGRTALPAEMREPELAGARGAARSRR